MTPDRDEESGKFTQEFSSDSFLEAVESLDNATTTKVAEHVGCSYDLAYRRLTKLADDGEIKKEYVGGIFIWKRTIE